MSLLGRIFRVMTFGESHASHVGCVIEGFPSNFKLDLAAVQKELNRRRPGQSAVTTPRDEADRVVCVSGLENGRTLGSPLCFLVANQNVKKGDYSELKNIARPGHADLTYLRKYGIKAESGGGRASARETIGRVIAGSVAKQFLITKGISFSAYVKQISDIGLPDNLNNKYIYEKITNDEIQKQGEILILKDGQFAQKTTGQDSIKSTVNLRCPHFETSTKMLSKIMEAKQKKDSLGGIVQGCIYGLPIGLGQPCFDKLPALMAHAMLSIPATKGFEYGSGFAGTKLTGSTHNDNYNPNLSLRTNNSGGTLGGISTGQTFYYSVAFKPVSSIGAKQETHDLDGKPIILETKGRHDPCVLPRAPPIVDNMAAIVVMDLWLLHNAMKVRENVILNTE